MRHNHAFLPILCKGGTIAIISIIPLEYLLAAVKPLKKSDSHSGTTVFHTPRSSNESFNSLLTEDLSEDGPVCSKPTKWYLFSEDESNTNFLDARSQCSNASSAGANLNQIFPLTCAVPDLSTISEISKENDSRRFALDADLETNSYPKNFELE